jgi:hypothetical protein
MSLLLRIVAVSLVILGVYCGCSDQTSAETCLSSNQQRAISATFCVWDYTSGRCSDDSCLRLSANATGCKAQTGCVLQPLAVSSSASSQYLCYNAQISCSMLTSGQCSRVSLCQTIGSACAFPLSFGASNITLEQQCAAFPMWSIALLIVWLVIMVIIGFIIMLIFKQRRDDAITEVEQSDVRIDSVQINRDNFSPRNDLERPLR